MFYLIPLPQRGAQAEKERGDSGELRPFTFFFFLAVRRGTQDLSSQTRVEPVPPAVEAQSPNHWTTREVPLLPF